MYKYPQAAFPYDRLVAENRRRGKLDPEFELADTGIFKGNRYFDVVAEYAKANTDDILIRITVANRGPEPATLHLLPTLWFRNSWSWGCTHEGCEIKPRIETGPDGGLRATHVSLGAFRFFAEPAPDGQTPPFLFTENETNFERLFKISNQGRPVKDAFHEFVIGGKKGGRQRAPRRHQGRAAITSSSVPAGEERVVRLRLFAESQAPATPFGADFDRVFGDRIRDTNEFYDAHLESDMLPEAKNIARQAYAGLLVEQAVLSLLGEGVADGRSGAASAAARTRARPQRRLAAPFQPRRDLDARQVGISRGTRRGTWRST